MNPKLNSERAEEREGLVIVRQALDLHSVRERHRLHAAATHGITRHLTMGETVTHRQKKNSPFVEQYFWSFAMTEHLGRSVVEMCFPGSGHTSRKELPS